jgi:hypothetical protein
MFRLSWIEPVLVGLTEDKIVQRAMVEVLNGIYEQDVLNCSYGFRPGRGQHRRWRKWVESSVPDPRDGSWN